ncbi:hypothetical protein EJ08DRAFT_594903 [Tothia fuscella]|uniref:Aminoglycoside phosphotransferase domain-containing protein n=1 Tax=Tothia fuscella TaxID=1048955 RepID=A0A9P4NK34_9PEZI|nr:hypothetical protein EJ08DRAFT_594903 [Tothia fuscella]
MAPEITTTIQMEEYLNLHSISHTSIDPLTAGGTNYSWMITAPDSSKSIVKHATPHLKILPHVSLPIERLEYEANAISTLSGLSLRSLTGDHIGVPTILHFNPKAHVLQIPNVGSRNLVEAFTSPELDMTLLGARIGKFLADLHSLPAELKVGNNQLVKLATQHCTQHLPRVLRERGYDDTVGARILDMLFDGQEDVSCQCHGDFLHSNIVVADSEGPSPKLTVIDWEWTRRGNGVLDVGLFAGEIWLMEYAHGKRGLLGAFLAAYVETRPLDSRDKLLAAARFAAHITYWATQVKWKEAEHSLDMSYRLLQKVLERDILWLRDSPIKRIFLD